MLDMDPNISDYKSETALSSPDNNKSSPFRSFSFSLASQPSLDKEYQCKTNPATIIRSDASLSLNSERFNEDFEYSETISVSPLDIKSRRVNKISSSNSDRGLNHKSAGILLEEDAESCGDIFYSKSFDRKHHFERSNKQPILDRRLTDSLCIWRGRDIPVQQRIDITRRVSMTDSNRPVTSPRSSPALCSICKHKTSIFRKAPRRFTYREIEHATDGFSNSNFMAVGVHGCTYRGELPDGQIIAVKKYKKLKVVAESEFCLEVETLGSSQHKNLLMLVGYCTDTEWLLIYEFACNGSLDMHLHESNQVITWRDRMKIAVGTARGLRYLHEDCRSDCIIHQDLRPSNILLTHDFEPMIGDFGLARWQLDAQLVEQTHLIGTFGYLAPECIQTCQFTEKADVYAFGVILLELLSGFRAMELSRKLGIQSLSQWGSTMLQKKMAKELVDSRLNNNYMEREVECMIHASYLCISPHPEQRPRMSQVLKILERDLTIDGDSLCQSPKVIFNNGSFKHSKDHMKFSPNNRTNLHADSDLYTISI